MKYSEFIKESFNPTGHNVQKFDKIEVGSTYYTITYPIDDYRKASHGTRRTIFIFNKKSLNNTISLFKKAKSDNIRDIDIREYTKRYSDYTDETINNYDNFKNIDYG